MRRFQFHYMIDRQKKKTIKAKNAANQTIRMSYPHVYNEKITRKLIVGLPYFSNIAEMHIEKTTYFSSKFS